MRRRWLAVTVAGVLLVAASIMASQVRLGRLASGPLLPTRFDHKFHRGINCVTCHHNFTGPRLGPQPCLACHKAWGTTEWRRIDTVFHAFCTDCHRARQAAGLEAGPVKGCAACHVERASPPLARRRG
jgi:predicted CXXCH cytochrome family protein